MDLEASEPIDLGAGDHQHLIRKAADGNVQTKSGQPYETSPSSRLKQTPAKPHPETGPGADSYVVQISDDVTPEDNSAVPSPFSETSVRRGENQEINFLGEKSQCFLKMFPQSGLSGRLNFALSVAQSRFTVDRGVGSPRQAGSSRAFRDFPET